MCHSMFGEMFISYEDREHMNARLRDMSVFQANTKKQQRLGFRNLPSQLTQLLVKFATIIAHVGNFDSRRRRGGSSPFFSEVLDLPAWINRSSDLLINWLSFGSFVTAYAHVVSQRSPRDEKKMKGPAIPIDDMAIGVSTNPATFPR